MFLDTVRHPTTSGDHRSPGVATDRRQVLDNFIRENEQRLFRFLQAIVKDQATALDILQDALLAFIKRYGSQSDPAEWPALIYRIAQNKARDHFRRNVIRRRWTRLTSEIHSNGDDRQIDALDPQSPAGDVLDQQESIVQIQRLIDKLPERQKQTVLLRTYAELSEAETAAVLSISIGSVKTHLSRARQNLREGFVALGFETLL